MARRVTPTVLDSVPEADSPADTPAAVMEEAAEQAGKRLYGAQRGLTGPALEKAWAAAPDGLRAYYTA
ncbi:hypothetical protein GCM10009592_14530 [Brachybacterium rhamnosum]|uniref:Uncharacterized protein n=1 Tax=Brachybacterium rhamnosum TaxID=173361 RepID=A0ABW4PW35_9MICO